MLWLQREEAAALQVEVTLLRQQGHELAGLRAEHARLEAAAVPAAELARLRADRATVLQLRGELDALRRSLEQREQALETKPRAQSAAGGPDVAVDQAERLRRQAVEKEQAVAAALQKQRERRAQSEEARRDK